jgi:predicted nucleotidyltransferase
LAGTVRKCLILKRTISKKHEYQRVSKEFKDEMIRLYGDTLYKVVLFGSFARNDSDVDFLVVLDIDEMRPCTEITKISPVWGNF